MSPSNLEKPKFYVLSKFFAWDKKERVNVRYNGVIHKSSTANIPKMTIWDAKFIASEITDDLSQRTEI